MHDSSMLIFVYLRIVDIEYGTYLPLQKRNRENGGGGSRGREEILTYMKNIIAVLHSFE